MISALLLLTILPIGVANPTTRLYVNPATKTVVVNSTFTIEIRVEDVTNMYGFEFQLYWKKNILNCTANKITPPSVWGSNWWWAKNDTNNNYDTTHGRYWVAVTALNPALPFSTTGSLSLVTLTFKALKAGSTTLDLPRADSLLPHYPEMMIYPTRQPVAQLLSQHQQSVVFRFQSISLPCSPHTSD